MREEKVEAVKEDNEKKDWKAGWNSPTTINTVVSVISIFVTLIGIAVTVLAK